ncbi:hypothetical protein Tco_0990633 [Tanacetum coccineum]|uniref:Reverse transcriptase Ty1/copia-type domain-containing protein n=1 Tax=Tanacetum coccineum TaxID=301880 RepID=A0ABQ5EX95_9ASTR
MKRSGFDLQQEFFKKDEASSFVQKQPARGSRKKSLSRKRARETLSKESAKKQKLEDDTKKEELQVYLNIIPEEESLNIESLATKQDVMELYRLVKERFQTASPKGYDLLLWGDLKTMIKPNEEDEIWRNQQYWNLINWKLHNFCEVHVLLMDTGFVIHMMAEKKYPLTQDTLSKILSRRLEVDHQSEIGYELISLIPFIEILSGESKVHIEVLLVLWGNRLPIPDGSLSLSRSYHLRFEDLYFLDRVYKVEKALYGLHQAPRAWYETLLTYLLDNGFQRGNCRPYSSNGTKSGLQFTMETQSLYKDETWRDVDVHMYRSMIGSLMYLTS